MWNLLNVDLLRKYMYILSKDITILTTVGMLFIGDSLYCREIPV